MIRFFPSVVLLAVLLFISCRVVQAKPELKIDFDEQGLSTIIHRGTVLLAPEDARAGVPLWTRPLSQSFDLETRTLSTDTPGWSYRVQYLVEDNKLTLVMHSTRKPEGRGGIWPLRLRLPRHRQNELRTIGELGGVLLHQTGTIGVVTETPGVTVLSNTRFPVKKLTTFFEFSGPRGRESRHPIVDNKWFNIPVDTVEVGETFEARASFIFGPPDATADDLFPEARERFIEKNPVVLNWPDRRPIGQIFFAHPTRGWKTNPRGFNFGRGEKHDVFTEEGLKVFGEELMVYADRCIAVLKAMNAQGVIVWNLEGEELYHPVSYLAEPRLLAEAAPEMERFADAFFKKFADAGLRTGITIRPTEVYDREPGKRRWNHRYVHDPVQLMSEKIAYAQKRWGVTIFYIDSNVFANDFGANMPKDHNVPWVMPVSMIEALNKLHPDVLLIPEWSDGGYYRFSAPYSSPNLGMVGTSRTDRERFPGGFRAVAVNTRMLEQHWEIFVENVQGGDVLMYPTWYNAPENAMVSLIYREAQFLKSPLPAELAAASPTTLAQKAASDDELTRFQVAGQLAKHTEPEALRATAKLLEDESLLVRKAALLAVRDQKQVADDSVTKQLLAALVKRDRGLLTFYADALGSVGETTVPHLMAILADEKNTQSWGLATRALGLSRTRDAEVEKQLIAYLADEKRKRLREELVRTLGTLGSTEAVPHLINLLDPTNKDDALRRAVVQALGQIGDKRAIGPLVAEWDRRPGGTMVYSHERVLDENLALVTGEKWLTGKGDWIKWWAANKPQEN